MAVDSASKASSRATSKTKCTSAELTKSSKPSQADGTKERPYKFLFNAKHPEAHPCDFVVTKKERTLVDGKRRTVLEIFKDLDCDFDNWSASVVTDGDYAMRAILFRGLAVSTSMLAYLEQTAALDENEPCHKLNIEIFLCAHEEAKKQNNVKFLFNHYMMILPKDMVVDDTATSSEGSLVDCIFTEIKYKPPLYKGLEVITTFGTWEVVVGQLSP